MAAIVTVAMAAPVLRAPSERVFGMEIVGRHHDPFTVMEQFERPISIGVYSQPLTDLPGALVARISGAVAAYNWLVLLSFPLSAAAAYLLARHLALSPAGATAAAMAYAFSPFHLAHAAYHPHIAQTQWLPLYLLALWRCLDRASPAAVGLLGAATMAVTLSNFYAGLIAAVITPVAVAAYWLVTRRADTRSTRRLAITVGSLLIIAAAGMAYASYVAGAVFANRAAFAFPRDDLFRYSAKWWSYLVPPVEHPLVGPAAHRLWTAAGVREGLLEQQVSLGWGIVALGLIASFAWLERFSGIRSAALSGPRPAGPRAPRYENLAGVPTLVIIAAAALLCSLSPERTIGAFTFVRPSALLYNVVPMFRSYARFGVVVQLMAALLAGIGIDWLRRAGTTRAQIVCVALVILAAGEYTVSPSALSRDVLPTTAHRWVVQQADPVRALDCTPLNQESESVQWLTGQRVTLLDGSISDCTDPNLSRKLAADGYTHLLVRRDTAAGQWFADHPAPDGLRVAARFDDGQVFGVPAEAPAIYTAAMSGFFPREHDAEWAWRWMGAEAAWTIVNAGARPIDATLRLEMLSFHTTRRLELLLDGHLVRNVENVESVENVETLSVEPSRRIYELGPLTVTPGQHALVFHAVEAPTVANDVTHAALRPSTPSNLRPFDNLRVVPSAVEGRHAQAAPGEESSNDDPRPLSFALGTWNWTVGGEQP